VVLEAVSKYGTISELNENLAKTDKRLKSAKNELASETGCLDEAKANLIKLKEPLESYRNVVKLGFSEAELRELANITQKYGGVKRVFEAIKAYADYTDICNEISGAKTTLAETKAEIAKMEEQHAHLKTAVEMCDDLIRTYKFGLDAITTIFSIAQKFGEPINVLKAVEEYGEVLTMQQQLEELEARVTELRRLVAELEARYQEMLDQLESLNARALNIGQDIGRLQSEIKQSKGLERILNLINDPESANYEEYGPLVLATAVSLRKFVLVHEQRFKFPSSIRSGLDGLIKDLGGK
jgi:chromosome segregation ATPase